MLWYKAWLETRWRFLIGAAVLLLSACAIVVTHAEVMKLISQAPPDVGGEIGRRIREAADLSREYRGYVWSQWFRQNLVQMWILFATILGTGGLLSQSSGGGALFTLSLPVARGRLLRTRAGVGLAELLFLALVPSLVIPLASPAIGQTYHVADAVIHATCLFVAGAVFFALTVLLSTVFNDVWRPFLIVLGAAMALAFVEQTSPALARYGLFRVMTAERYFRAGALPWAGLLAAAGLSIALLYGAARRIARRDF